MKFTPLFLFSVLLGACGGGGGTADPDMGTTRPDTGVLADGGSDAGRPNDAGSDAPATADAGSDSGSDTGPRDAGRRSGDSGVAMDQCQHCHGDDLSGGTIARGGVFPPNITPDVDNGIGSWTDAQILTAVRTGVDDVGATLCSSMPRFTLTDPEAATLLTFLHGFAASPIPSAGGTCTAP